MYMVQDWYGGRCPRQIHRYLTCLGYEMCLEMYNEVESMGRLELAREFKIKDGAVACKR